jgi:hypothetical protein
VDQRREKECDPKFDKQPGDAIGELKLVDKKVAVGGKELRER